jgi:methylase of polypeptide subunit release factors
MGKYITQRLKIRTDQLKWKDVKVVDAFCGSGGLAIQMAQEFKDIEASDIDPM